MEYTTANLFSFNAIDDRVHKRREKEIYIAHYYVYYMGNILPKSMDKCQANDSDIKDQDAAYMGNTSVECLGPIFFRHNAHDSLKNKNIRTKDYEEVQ